MATATSTEDLSIVVPAYNEERRIGRSLVRIVEYLDGRGTPFEIVLVDDGSSDATVEAARAELPGDRRLQVIRIQQNRGKGNAPRRGT